MLYDDVLTVPSSPLQLSDEFAGEHWPSISAGDFLSCGVLDSGVGACWSNNDSGQVGPVAVGGDILLPAIVDFTFVPGTALAIVGRFESLLAGGSHVCGIKLGEDSIVPWVHGIGQLSVSNVTETRKHHLSCFGSNQYGQLNLGEALNFDVTNGYDESVSVGMRHTVLLNVPE